jgi:hypothetical protein
MYWHFPYQNRKVKNCKHKRLKTPKLEKLIGMRKYWYLHRWLWHGEHTNTYVISLKIWSMFDHRWVFCYGWFYPIHFEYGNNIKTSIQDYLSKWNFRLRIMLYYKLFVVGINFVWEICTCRFNLNTSYWSEEACQLIGIRVLIIYLFFWWFCEVSGLVILHNKSNLATGHRWH